MATVILRSSLPSLSAAPPGLPLHGFLSLPQMRSRQRQPFEMSWRSPLRRFPLTFGALVWLMTAAFCPAAERCRLPRYVIAIRLGCGDEV